LDRHDMGARGWGHDYWIGRFRPFQTPQLAETLHNLALQ
jgi:hypothetical protein